MSINYKLLWLLACCLMGCQSTSLAEPKQEILQRPMMPVPEGYDTDDIYVDEEAMGFITSMMHEHSNGMGLGVQTAYKYRYEGLDGTFFVTDEWEGKLLVASGKSEEHNFAVVCLLDYVQIPCHPDLPKEHIITTSTNDFLALQVPLKITNVSKGLHDLMVFVVRDPYEEGVNAIGDDIRYSMLRSAYHANLLGQGVLTPATEIDPIELEGKKATERQAILDVLPHEQLLDELNHVLLWIDAEGKAGQEFPFYLHFSSDVFDEKGDTLAVMAFINYEQVPIIYEGEAHTPLYVAREFKSWQMAPASIQLPDEPGTYELVVVARTDALTALEVGQDINGGGRSFSTDSATGDALRE